MPEDLFIPIEKQTTETIQVGVTCKEVSILMADADSAGVIALVLAPKDAEGKWRDDVQGIVVRKIDDLESENPQERFAASMFHNLMFTALVADTPTHRALGIVGMPVWDAAKVILGQELAGGGA